MYRFLSILFYALIIFIFYIIFVHFFVTRDRFLPEIVTDDFVESVRMGWLIYLFLPSAVINGIIMDRVIEHAKKQ